MKKLDVPGAPESLPRVRAARLRVDDRSSERREAARCDVDRTNPVVFGVVHTDSNHHVNSLVYFRLFEEAALRRFAQLGAATPSSRARSRSPTESRVSRATHARPRPAAEVDGRLAVVTAIAPEGEGVDKAHAAARMLFE